MANSRQSATDKRCAEWAAHVKSTYKVGDGPLLVVTWKKSRTWGMCPSIRNEQGGIMARASGCGYDKGSTVLANVLSHLAETPEGEFAIACTYGAGERSVQRELLKHGWDLRKGYDGRHEKAYSVIRVEVKP